MDSTLFEKYHADVKRMVAENERIAIHAVLEEIFLAGVACRSELIVELGAGMERLSTNVLSKIADLLGANHIGIDKRDYSNLPDYGKFHFVHSDDIEFSNRFEKFCLNRKIVPMIDLLFVDTDELYFHVKQEIEKWFPYLKEQCTVMFRCTNLQKTLYYKNGRTTNLGWNNERGVILALTEYLGTEFDETKEWSEKVDPWEIQHWPWGAGLTVMRRG